MAISEQPSKLSLPQTNPGVATVLEYLIIKFPYIAAHIWIQRMAKGKVHLQDGSLINPQSPFTPQQRIYYYREVKHEPIIPFAEDIVFQDEHILIAYKPHFLPVTPGGQYVNECLQNRLRQRTGLENLQAMHRLDRVTAGLVLFSVNPDTRHRYHALFEKWKIHKTYQAIAEIRPEEVQPEEVQPEDVKSEEDKNEKKKEGLIGQTWQVKNRIIPSQPRFRMRISEGEANSHSMIRCIKLRGNKALFELSPVTGKTHQLRLHMQSLGFPILNDKYYPELQPLSEDNYSAPLQLLARELKFIDPMTKQTRYFSYKNELDV